MVRPGRGRPLAEPEANVFLYQVTPNGALRNEDLPTRSGNGALRRRPPIGLDLRYLISFYGNEKTLEPQRMLGGVVGALHARPQVTDSAIEAIVNGAAVAALDEPIRFLGQTDLGQQPQRVTIAPLSLDLEELSRLWSILFQVPYVLSVAYQASVVLIEAQVTPQPALPVRLGNVRVLPIEQPLVKSVSALAGVDEPIVSGATLAVRGSRLRGEDTRVRIGGAVVVPDPQDVGEAEIRAILDPELFPGKELRAGIQGAQVVHMLDLGTPPQPHRGFESNVAPFVLQPLLSSASVTKVSGKGKEPRSATVKVVAAPPIGAKQRVVLLLDDVGGAEALSFPAPERRHEGDPVEVPIDGGRPANTWRASRSTGPRAR